MNEILTDLVSSEVNITKLVATIALIILLLPAINVFVFKFTVFCGRLFFYYTKFTVILMVAIIGLILPAYFLKKIVDKEEAKYELKTETTIPKAIIVNEK